MSDGLICCPPYRGASCVRPWLKYNHAAFTGATRDGGFASEMVAYEGGELIAPRTSVQDPDNGSIDITMHHLSYTTGELLSSDVHNMAYDTVRTPTGGSPSHITGFFGINSPRWGVALFADDGDHPGQPNSSAWIYNGARAAAGPILPAFPCWGDGTLDTYYAVTRFMVHPINGHIYAIGGNAYYGDTHTTDTGFHQQAWLCRYPVTGGVPATTADLAYKLSDVQFGGAYDMNMEYDGEGRILLANGGTFPQDILVFDPNTLALLHTWTGAGGVLGSPLYAPVMKYGYMLAGLFGYAPHNFFMGMYMFRINSDYTVDFLGFVNGNQSGQTLPTEPNEFSTFNNGIVSITCQP